MNYKPFLIILYLFTLFGLVSCKKYLDIGAPPNQLTGETLFNSDNTAISGILSIYSNMEQSGFSHNLMITAGTAADEFINYNTSIDAVAIATNNLTPENATISSLWSSLYNYIYQANAMIEGISRSLTLSEPVRQQLLGEAYFIRAFCHFYLLQLFGNIPFNKTTDYAITSVQLQEKADVLLPTIIEDLQKSKSLLKSNYVNSTNITTSDRVRPNKYTAAALLAKAYLFEGNWQNAESEADTILQLTSLYTLSNSLNNVFLKTSSEAIWQLQPVVPGFNSFTGSILQPSTYLPFVVTMTQNIMDSFETTDLRKTSWITPTIYNNQTFYWLHKYKAAQNASSAPTEFTTLIRLAEVFLIRAEARAMQEKLFEALGDLNKIRSRAGLADLQMVNKEDILNAIYKERRLELFGELGDRWIDLIRTGRANAVLPIIKGSSWSATDMLFPIPQSEMLRHPGMVQNPGY